MTKNSVFNMHIETKLNESSEEVNSKLAARHELYSELQKGLDSIAAGRTIPADEAFAILEADFAGYVAK